jgi:Na+/melibiose symporter-like transporter
MRVRAVGMGVGSVVLWAATGIIAAIFPTMSDPHKLGLGHSMWVFAAVNILLFVLVLRLVPETKGRSLEQIELDLRERVPLAAKVEV